MLNTEYRECSEEEIEKYNQNVLTTVKTIKEEVEEVIEEVIEEKQEEVEELKNDILKYQEYLNNLEKYKLVDLIKILEEFGLTKSGNKNVKVDRLREFLQRKLEEEEEEGDVEVVEWEFDGEDYLVDEKSNVVYSVESQEEVGKKRTSPGFIEDRVQGGGGFNSHT